MKQNRKNRRLKYIRVKNFIQSRGILKVLFKVSDEMLTSDLIKVEAENQLKEASRYWHLKFIVDDVVIGESQDDYINNMYSVRLKLKVVR